MLIPLFRLIPPAILGIAMLVFGWFDAFHFTVAAAVYFIANLVALLESENKALVFPLLAAESIGTPTLSPPTSVCPRTTFAPRSTRAVAQGVALLAVVALVSWVASFVPGLQKFILDQGSDDN